MYITQDHYITLMSKGEAVMQCLSKLAGTNITAVSDLATFKVMSIRGEGVIGLHFRAYDKVHWRSRYSVIICPFA